jgi:hypothetical protein
VQLAESGLPYLMERNELGAWLRLTLSADGQVLMFDSIHNCGCYHVFVPAQTLRPKPAPSRQEWAFVPTSLPALLPGQRLRVRLSSEDHQVIGLASEPLTDPDDTAVAYGMEDDKGHLWLSVGDAKLKRERRVSRSLDLDSARAWAEENGHWDDIKEVVEVLSEDKLLNLAWVNKDLEETIQSFYIEKETWAFKA